MGKVMLEVNNLKTKYVTRFHEDVYAVDGVSLKIEEGKSLGVAGESGCGKSTTGKLIDHLITPDSGEIWFEGKEISRLSEKEMRPLRSDIQMVFQDPYGSVYSRTDPGKRLYPVEDHCQRKNDTWNGIGQRSTFFHGHSPFTVSSYFHIGCCSSHNNTDSTSHKCQKDTVSDSGKNTSVCKYKSKIFKGQIIQRHFQAICF